MTDLVASGENGRRSGYNYEDVIVEMINNYNNDRQGLEIVQFIANDMGINYREYDVTALKAPKVVPNIFGGTKKPPKADVQIFFTHKITKKQYLKGISLKSSNINIQVLITNVTAFLEVCENYGIRIPDGLEIGLSKFCGYGKYKPSLMLSELEIKKLKQGDRDRWLIYELSDSEQDIIEKFFNENQKKITEIVLEKGSGNPEYRADYYLVNKTKFSDTREVDFWIDNIDMVIDRCVKHGGYLVTEKGSFHIGSITVQMKGSGQGEAYHGLQFNKAGI